MTSVLTEFAENLLAQQPPPREDVCHNLDFAGRTFCGADISRNPRRPHSVWACQQAGHKVCATCESLEELWWAEGAA